MHNVVYKVAGDKLMITVDLTEQAFKAAPPSASGKTTLVGSTGGPCPIPSPNGATLSFALNVMAKANAK